LSNICDLAAADALAIIEDEGAGSPLTLISEKGEFLFPSIYSDIGSLINPISGEPVQGRNIEVAIPAQAVITAAGSIPKRGWKARLTEKNGQEITLFVQRNEYDRTIGICRLTLGLQLGDAENE